MATAYGSLTILDMVDSATYIYYADDVEGKNPSTSPENKKYIGFYSGPSYSEQPNAIPSPDWEASWWSGWIKYVGEDGSQGESVTITGTSVEYAKTTIDYENPENITASWSTSIPTINQGEYLWTRTTVAYSDGKSTTTYGKSYLGKDGEAGEAANLDIYRIEFSQEEILKFAKSVGEDGQPTSYTYSPDKLTIWVYKNDELTMDETVEMTVGGVDITDTSYFVKNLNNYTLDVNYLDSVTATRDLSSIPFVFKIKKILNEGTDEETTQIKATRPIICRNGMNSDMATFALNASGINAAIQSTALAFDANGLTVTNGGLKIVRVYNNGANKEDVFYADLEGNLILKGEITATSGYIGSIAIKDNSLVGDNNSYIISPNGIVANNITLKQGAIIENYIQLGDSYLYNPDAKDSNGNLIRANTDPAYRAVLQSGKLLIKDTGYMTLGDISLFGGTDTELAYISSRNNQWKIWENGRADFQDIYANNCHMGNTILEVNTIQSAGNLTVYADSWTLAGVDGTSFLVDRDPAIPYSEDEPVVLFGKNKYYQITGEIVKLSETLFQIPVDKDVAGEGFQKGDVITKIGKIGEAVLCISGQGSNSTGFATESSLTLSFLESFENSTPSFETKLSLGLLDKLGKPGITGYGLYAENVYLRGSLTTVSTGDSISYAGINTTNGVKATIFGSTTVGGTSINDTSSIIFWAGAAGPNDEYIQSAPFQITEEGTLYASKGVFEGSIISKSTIQGSDIYAARIHGWKDSSKAPLTIYDTEQGIVFKSGYQSDEEVETLKINSSGLVARNNKPFILLEGTSNQTVTFQGNYAKFTEGTSQIVIDSLGIKNQISDGDSSWSTQTQLNLSNDFSFLASGIEIARFNGDLIGLNATTTNMKKHVQFGESVNLLYKQVDAGYDLYVN